MTDHLASVRRRFVGEFLGDFRTELGDVVLIQALVVLRNRLEFFYLVGRDFAIV